MSVISPGKQDATMEADPLEMKCRKCRNNLLTFPTTRVESSHGALATDTAADDCPSEVWYIPEDHMPSWMTPNVEKGEWVKGKVQCPKCDGRLGSYNFVSGMKCPCGSQVVAPIHIVKSKVDFFIPPRETSDLEKNILEVDRPDETLGNKDEQLTPTVQTSDSS